MLDQSKFSGIGNYLRAEILYQCRISPWRKLSELSEKEQELLYFTTLKIMKRSYESNGKTLKSYVTPEGHNGKFRCVVYGCSSDPDGNIIKTEKDSTGRMIHWVPAVQK